MINLNSKSKLPTPSNAINKLIDEAIVKKRSSQPRRKYLGASMLGQSCQRAIQYEFLQYDKDPGKDFSARVYRIFQAGHELEESIVKWFRDAGFDLRNEKSNGDQFGFEVAGGVIQGHIDGVLCGGPDCIKYPALWEAKSMSNKKFNAFVKNGVAKSHPQYAAQVALYQAYMNLSDNPAVLTAINKDDSSLHHEIIPFNAQLAQEISDRAVNIIQSGENMLPRISNDPGWYECSWCSYSRRCHGVDI